MLRLYILATAVNLFIMYSSLFDVYFKSPLVPVLRKHRLDEQVVKAPFKRVLFIVADGLRQDVFFENTDRLPFFRDVMKSNSEAVWGISNGRPPTESSPSFVAMFAGFYQDPSSIFVRWKEYIEEFDSIFNHVSSAVSVTPEHTTEDLEKRNGRHIFLKSYANPLLKGFEKAKSKDDFAYNNLSDLAINLKLPEGRKGLILLDFHTVDAIAHAMNNASPKLEENAQAMEAVDVLVQKCVKLVQDYYGDNDTLHVFTADHGMADLGSHGSGTKGEIEMPFLLWGKGIDSKDRGKVRFDNVDFAPLLASVLGVVFPTNSIGKFPDFMWKDRKFAYEALNANLNQMLELMGTKQLRVQSDWFFPVVQFEKKDLILESMKKAQAFAYKANYNNAIQEMKIGLDMAVEGVYYYEKYGRLILQVLVACT